MRNIFKFTQSIIAMAVLLCSIIIWGCSQDDIMENNQPVYRYSADETATLKTLAEDYEYPVENLIFESNTPLPTIEEYEKFFQVAYGITQDLSLSLDTISVDNNTLHLRTSTNQNSFPRKRSGAMEYTGKNRYTFRHNGITGNSGDFAYIDVYITLVKASPTDPWDPRGSTSYTVSVVASMSLSYSLQDTGYEIGKFEYKWQWRGSSEIEIQYKFTVTLRGSSITAPINGSGTCSVNVTTLHP